MDISQVKNEINFGDRARIAEKVGVTTVYVKMILDGKRTPKKKKGIQVILEAIKLSQINREFMSEKI